MASRGHLQSVDSKPRAATGELLPGVGSKMRWDYDFGDGWEHEVVVEAVVGRECKISVEAPCADIR